jgi:glyoxylate/hydroxypyruvate reductase A
MTRSPARHRRPRRCTILVYHPEQAARYAEMIRAPRGCATVFVASTPEDAEREITDVDVLYGWKVPPSVLAGAKQLAWIQVTGAGVDWALGPELAPGVVVTRTPGVFGPWMAEYVLGWSLWVTQHMTQYLEAQRARRWREELLPDSLRGKTLTIVGLGDIGRTIARAARRLGVRTMGVSRSGRRVPAVDRVYPPAGLRRALAEADFVVLTVPLTEETRGLIGARELAGMRPSAWLLNVARGEVVDEPALLDALARRTIAGAVLDVVSPEPLPADHPLWSAPNVVITPHISGPSTPEEIAPIFNDNLARFLGGRRLRHVVDRARGY